VQANKILERKINMGEMILRINKKTLKASIEGDGFTGGQCVTDIDALQQALGFTTLTESPKDEMVQLVGETGVSQGH